MGSEQLPPGWYTTDDGESKYWDGTNWLRPAANDDSLNTENKKRRVRWPLTTSVVIIALAAIVTTAYFITTDQIERQTAQALEEAAAEADQIAAAQAAEAEAAAEAAQKEEDEARAAEEAKKAADIEERIGYVEKLEEHVFKTAEERKASGYYEEKILYATCMPVTGSAIEELDEISTSFSCLAVTKENDDRTVSGYEITAVINWNTGEMTWG